MCGTWQIREQIRQGVQGKKKKAKQQIGQEAQDKKQKADPQIGQSKGIEKAFKEVVSLICGTSAKWLVPVC